MARNAAEVAIKTTNDVGRAVDGFDDVGRSAVDMADQVDRASRSVDDSTNRLGSAADAADDMAGKTGKATGALGALAGGLEAVGLGPYAAALSGVSVATDVASGAGDLFNLVMTSSTVLTVKDRAAKIAHSTATVASTVATKAATVANKALNLVLRANPIGLVISGLILLASGIIYAYKHSERFRTIVDRAMQGARTAIGWVVDRAADVREGVKALADKVGPILDRLKGIFTRVFEAILSPIEAVKDAIDVIATAVENVIELIGKIHLPDLPDLIPFNGRTVAGSGGRPAAGTVPTTIINVTGAVDPASTARQIATLLRRQGISVGTVTS